MLPLKTKALKAYAGQTYA